MEHVLEKDVLAPSIQAAKERGEITDKEAQVIQYIAWNVEQYALGGDVSYSDVMFEDIVRATGWTDRTLKGVLGSLSKKNLVLPHDVNGEYNVYYLEKKVQEWYGWR